MTLILGTNPPIEFIGYKPKQISFHFVCKEKEDIVYPLNMLILGSHGRSVMLATVSRFTKKLSGLFVHTLSIQTKVVCFWSSEMYYVPTVVLIVNKVLHFQLKEVQTIQTLPM